MYWFRDSFLLFIPWVMVMLLNWFGGWMIVSCAFRLKSHERMIAGFGFGLGLYVFITNLFGYFLPARVAFSLPAVVIFALGFLLTFRKKKLHLEWKDLLQWKLLLFGLLLTLFILRIEQGLAISDDPKNLTLISQLAVGDFPPNHYLDASLVFSYHYGFHIIGASLMSIGNAMPWSAFDISKAILSTYSLILIYLIAKRYINTRYGAEITTVLYAFFGGTRWLFFLLPQGLIKPLDDLISLQGTSVFMNVPFTQALFQQWTLDGGPPLGYTFGFLNSLNGFFFHSHVGTSALAGIMLLLIWLSLNHSRTRYSFLLYIPLLAVSALAAETTYGMFAFGIASIAVFAFIRRKADKHLEMGLLLALVISIPFVAVQGGYLTNKASKILSGDPLVTSSVEDATDASISSSSESISDYKFLGFSVRWPPAIPNAHLGELSLFNPLTLLTAFLEIGPFLLIIPWVIAFAWKKYKDDDIFWGITTVSAILAFLIPIFIQYYVDRDITKIFSYSVGNWKRQFLIFLWVPLTAIGWKRYVQKGVRVVAILATALAVMGGVVVSIFNFSAISQPVLSYRINSLDANVASDTWNTLDGSSLIFDNNRWRVSALTGLSTEFGVTSKGKPEWNEINQTATIVKLAAAGYRYVYIDKEWWYNLPASSRQNLSQECVTTITEYVDDWPLDIPDFRRLIDISACTQ